jgi:hypothetical protein
MALVIAWYFGYKGSRIMIQGLPLYRRIGVGGRSEKWPCFLLLILTHIAITIKGACCISQFRIPDFDAHCSWKQKVQYMSGLLRYASKQGCFNLWQVNFQGNVRGCWTFTEYLERGSRVEVSEAINSIVAVKAVYKPYVLQHTSFTCLW